MSTLEIKNRDYQRKIENALFEAVMKASLDPETNVAALMSGEIVSACLTLIAFMAGTSEATETPTRTREFADSCAKTLKNRISEVKKQQAAGNLDWITIVNANQRH